MSEYRIIIYENGNPDDRFECTMVFAPSEEAAMKFLDGPSTGIDTMTEEDNAEPEYFNMSGIRVNAPGKGLYIVKRGNKVTKENFK